MKTVLDRFLEYIRVDTTSDESSSNYPSTPAQLELGKRLVLELQQLGLHDACQDEYGYVTATIPANRKGGPVLGLVSHLDTSDAVSGANIQPRLVKYTGGDIALNESLTMKAEDFPFLENFIGKTLVVTDGTTLLGADDKSGVAEIVTLAERLMQPNAPAHGKIRIAFTPDEEISGGTRYFDVKKFGADLAFTVDGGLLGELEYENFNAATATIEIEGRSIHPGAAKGKMVNACVLACELQALLPSREQPAFTDGYEGFFHLLSVQGNVEHCTMKIALREHDAAKFQVQKDWLLNSAEEIHRRWGCPAITVAIKDQYFNMRSVIDQHMEVVEAAKSAFEACGVTPKVQPIRGGTDGARLSFAGLPCPNLSTGGANFHSRYECIPVEDMECMVDVLTALAGQLSGKECI